MTKSAVAQGLVGQKRFQLRARRDSERAEARFGPRDVIARQHGRHEPHERTVATPLEQRIDEDVPLHCVLARQLALTLLEPVIDELPLITELDQRAIDLEAVDAVAADSCFGELRDPPTA